MLINVKVIPNARKNEVVEKSTDFMKIKLTSHPEKGKANDTLIKFLAQYFNISKSAISIKKGAQSKNKIIEIIK